MPAAIRSNLQYVDRFIAVSAYYAGFMADYLGISTRPDRSFSTGHLAQKDIAGGAILRRSAESRLFRPNRTREGTSYPRAKRVAHERTCRAYGPPGISLLTQAKYLRHHWTSKYEGSPDRAGKIAFLQSIDVFSMPSPYADPKGLSLLEAMANGVPVVQPSRGAFPEIVGKTKRRRPVRIKRTQDFWPPHSTSWPAIATGATVER